MKNVINLKQKVNKQQGQPSSRHCEERSDEAIPFQNVRPLEMGLLRSLRELAMTAGLSAFIARMRQQPSLRARDGSHNVVIESPRWQPQRCHCEARRRRDEAIPLSQERSFYNETAVPSALILKKSRWFIGAGIFAALVVLVLSFTLFKKDTATTSAAWFSDEWHYRASFDVFNASTTEDLLDFQVELPTSTLALSTAWTNGKLKNDFTDLRFTDMGGNLLDYWFPDATSTMMSVYVKMPTMPKNATSTVMMYYGNPSATDERDGNKVFPDFFDDFSDGAYAAGPRLWTVQSGTYSVTGSPDKYLNNSSAGVISTPLTKASGVWEFNLYKNADANASNVYFMDADTTTSGAGYNFQFNSSEAAVLNETSVGDLLTSANGYIDNAQLYKVKIFRSPGGAFSVYVNGTLVNSATDSTTNSSVYFVVDLDAGDRIDNILWRKFATAEPVVVATAGTSEEVGGGPIGYWSFDEGYGTTTYDRSGSGNNGVLTNMATTGTSTAWVIGKMNKALQFDGVNDYVNVGNVNKTVNSVSFWLNAKYLIKDIIDFDGGTHYITFSAGTLSATGFTSPTIYVDGKVSSKIYLNKWHYITVTTATGFTSNNLKLGLKTSYWQGFLDEVKIYNYTLTASQIKAEYNKGKSVILSVSEGSRSDMYNGLIGYWKMDEAITTWDGTGDRVNDYSGLGNHGAASGNAHATTTAKYGNAGEFDGTDDFVTLPASATIAGSSKATISAWVRLRSLSQTSCIYCSQTSTAGNDRLGLYVDTNGKVNLIYRDSYQDPAGNATTITGNVTLSINTWYFVSAVYDADVDKQTIYVNGFQDRQASNIVSAFGASTSNGIKIGDNNGNNEINGMIDNVKLYSTARTPDQIMNDYLIDPGPIASYNFEEKSGLILNDISGQGNNGTITAGASKGFVKGKVGRAYDFDGTQTPSSGDTKIVIPASVDLRLVSGGSISVWAQFDSAGENGTSRIWDKSTAGNGIDGYALWVNSNKLNFQINNQTLLSSANNSIIYGSNWYHIVVTFGSNGRYIYINGIISNYSAVAQAIPDVAAVFTIGNMSGASARTFDGRIDDLKVFNYVLTPWQIAQEYNSGRPSAHWGLDENMGTTANNVFAQTSGALAGTLTNMSTTGTSTAWQTGKFGKGLLFDGTNDTVAVTDGTNSALDMAFAGSLSAWVKPTSVSGNKYIIDKVESTQYALLLSGANVKGYFGNSSCSGGTVKANEWSYVSVVWDGAYIRCYLNGNEVGKTAYSTALTAQNTSLYIGSDGGAASWFKGIIDEPKIYQYALSPVQVKKDYNDGAAVILSVSEGSRSNSQNGLVGYWKMDESTALWDGDGDRVNDYSGNGYNGIAAGNAAATASGKYGNAGNFDGTDDYVTIPAGATLAGKTQATVSAWVYADDFGVTSCIYCEQTSTAGNDRFGLYVDTNGKVALTYRDASQDPAGTATTLTGNTALSASTWYYITAVYDADNDIQKIYINGSEDKKASASISGFGSSVSNAIRIADLNGSNEWDGKLDDVKVYSTARTSDQIMNDYLQGPGPIASYNFEEKSGTTLNDISGRGNNGTITAGASKGFVKGKIGRAYDFDGANTKIDTGSDWIGAAGYTTQALSISTWIYLDGWGENASGRILDNGKAVFRITENYLVFSSDGATTATGIQFAIGLGRWYHVVATRNSAGAANLYINGVLSGNPNQSSGAPAAGTTNVYIGNRNNAGDFDRTFDGQIDDLKVYNYVLTPEQIAQEYNGGKPIAYYKMDEGENKTVADWSGNGYNGTLSLSGSPATSTAWQVQTGCKVGKCLAFDGTNDYVGLSSSLTVTGEATVSAWIRPNSVAAGAQVIAGDSNSGNTTQQLSLQLNNTAGKISGKWGNSTIITSNKSLSADTWYYVTLARGGTTGAWTAKIYINGVLDNSATTATNPSSVSSWSIGRAGAYAGSYFNGKIDDLKIYNYANSPQQIKEDYNAGYGTYFKNEWQCGDYFIDGRDNQSYNTVLIGNQCWMNQNLNYGTQVNSPAAASVTTACTGHIGETLAIDGTSCYCETADYASCQLGTVGGTTQKYCYSNTASMCTAEGGLYEWQEAMDLAGSCAHTSCTPASGNKGICPAGWHIPTDAEWKTLEINQGMSQAQANATSWRGNQEGDKLKGADLCQGRIPCATSGFKGLLAGYRGVTGSFYGRSSSAYFWSSSQGSATGAWSRYLYVSYSTVGRGTDGKYRGFTVRCIKD